jgi:hypothetical protein
MSIMSNIINISQTTKDFLFLLYAIQCSSSESRHDKEGRTVFFLFSRPRACSPYSHLAVIEMVIHSANSPHEMYAHSAYYLRCADFWYHAKRVLLGDVLASEYSNSFGRTLVDVQEDV